MMSAFLCSRVAPIPILHQHWIEGFEAIKTGMKLYYNFATFVGPIALVLQ